jgi:hypothetical protein
MPGYFTGGAVDVIKNEFVCIIHHIGLGIEEEPSEVLHLEHNFIWC